ncbi:short chain dehydrogenase [Streptomyces endophytica]|uniref:Short chain dehydrogenase n=1 Tax=Streptomyces endophytica TaxID=2991496 RepID=A0ABY6PLK9_9ACTN|nr:short chain dehydrogenase [Streptomyces endophytica]UZJ34237.1 short chain dehydrogenase [Streptomyces endophytica]
MKIIVIGATGTLGSAVARHLTARGHEVVRAARRGPVPVDLADPVSLDALFATVRGVDAVICCAASGQLTPLDSPSDEEFTTGLDGKLLGQVHLVRRALHHLRDGGAVILTSGTFAEPTPGGAFGALVNAGLDAFVRAAALELPRGLRLDVVSPGWVAETLAGLGLDPAEGTPADEVARAYVDLLDTLVPRAAETRSPRPAEPATLAE